MKSYFEKDGITIYCGDCRDILPQLPNNCADLILTDPEYYLDEVVKLEFHKLMLPKAPQMIIFSPPESPWILPADQYLFWVKPISTKNTSKHYSRFVEEIFVYGESYWNIEYHWSQYSNVFNDLVVGKGIHAHEKPLSLIERFLRLHTKEGDTVLDPFLGSGITTIAAKRLKRKCIGIDINEGCCKIAMEKLI